MTKSFVECALSTTLSEFLKETLVDTQVTARNNKEIVKMIYLQYASLNIYKYIVANSSSQNF